MNIISQIVIVFYCLSLFTACNINTKNLFSNTDTSRVDYMNIKYLDTVLIGKQHYPTTTVPNDLKNILNEKILLFFETDKYYYVFFNKMKQVDFLTSGYWDRLMTKYIDFSINDGLLSYTRYIKVDYYDPFLTGFYNTEDSIIISGFDYRISDLLVKDRFSVSYFSTFDTTFVLNEKISVGNNLENIFTELQIPISYLKEKKEFELVLMGATTLIDNAWFNNYPKHCTDNTVAVILTIKNNKLTRIQYLNNEFKVYIFLQKSILTRDIHYH